MEAPSARPNTLDCDVVRGEAAQELRIGALRAHMLTLITIFLWNCDREAKNCGGPGSSTHLHDELRINSLAASASERCSECELSPEQLPFPNAVAPTTQ